jgi:hypothetical protein
MFWSGIKKRLPAALLLFTFGCTCFGYGVVAAWFEVFPFGVIRDARTAAVALVEATRPIPYTGSQTHQDQVLAPIAKTLAPSAGTELILASGGAGFYSEYHEAGCDAWLMDRSGAIKHIWKHDPSLWKDLEHTTRVPGITGEPYPVGLHLYDDGGLLATYHAPNAFPFAIGLARFDVNSNLLWKKELHIHHWVTVAPDGKIYATALRVVDSPVPIANTEGSIKSSDGKSL